MEKAKEANRERRRRKVQEQANAVQFAVLYEERGRHVAVYKHNLNTRCDAVQCDETRTNIHCATLQLKTDVVHSAEHLNETRRRQAAVLDGFWVVQRLCVCVCCGSSCKYKQKGQKRERERENSSRSSTFDAGIGEATDHVEDQQQRRKQQEVTSVQCHSSSSFSFSFFWQVMNK